MLFQRFINFGPVEANDYVAADIQNRYAHLVGLLDSFLSIYAVALNVLVGVFDAKFVEVLFGGVAECAPSRAVDCNSCRIAHSLIIAQAIQSKVVIYRHTYAFIV